MQALLKELQNEARILQHVYGELASIKSLKNFLRLKNHLAGEHNSGRVLMLTGEKHSGGGTLYFMRTLPCKSVQPKQFPCAALSQQFSINPETF